METLNLIEKLKECPKGTPLYSPLFGEVEFDCVCENGVLDTRIYVAVTGKDGHRFYDDFAADGRYYRYDNAECLLFPSKENRDWSKFNAPKALWAVID